MPKARLPHELSWETFWRIQDPGFPLSRSHRSTTWGEAEEDPGEEHRGTSAWQRLDLAGRGALTDVPHIAELIWFVGEEVDRGRDGEPIVFPVLELRRWRYEGRPGYPWSSSLVRARKVADLEAAGWIEVPTMTVIE